MVFIPRKDSREGLKGLEEKQADDGRRKPEKRQDLSGWKFQSQGRGRLNA